jgi:hypothetical protein
MKQIMTIKNKTYFYGRNHEYRGNSNIWIVKEINTTWRIDIRETNHDNKEENKTWVAKK